MIKLGLVSMVKNESDIIELFLRINIRSFNQILLVDHRSNDGTAEIIQEVQKKNTEYTFIFM